ncbi:hypothetical protein HPB49_021154 [Dermacentor silvarum]|uniref:Uncharacterized protein n=1 Tax=Dermacentor silvarum TaxID=543639 RepID=A0ACB8DQW6_DERSI|nr:hypothetical protein HPB49_021154 [Dermacentor silvarum]
MAWTCTHYNTDKTNTPESWVSLLRTSEPADQRRLIQPLQVELSERSIKACGTMRANREGMPSNFLSDKEMKRDDIASFSPKGIACVKWMDNRAVVFLSNFISPVENVHVQRRCAGNKQKMDVHCPLVLEKYNKFICGVDLMDQKKVTYEVDRRSKIKYYLRVFFIF